MKYPGNERIMKMLRLRNEYRGVFKEPFGTLYPTMDEVIPLLAGHGVYTVGDVVTCTLLEHGVQPNVAIIDGSTRREKCSQNIDFAKFDASGLSFVTNPPGCITDELIAAVISRIYQSRKGDAFGNRSKFLIQVRDGGEEDLAVLPVILYAAYPPAIVLYGQPNEGVVVIDAAMSTTMKAMGMLRYFDLVDDSIVTPTRDVTDTADDDVERGRHNTIDWILEER